jgi:hypothetical protein
MRCPIEIDEARTASVAAVIGVGSLMTSPLDFEPLDAAVLFLAMTFFSLSMMVPAEPVRGSACVG